MPRPVARDERGVHSYMSEVHCTVGSIHLFDLIEVTTYCNFPLMLAAQIFIAELPLEYSA